MTLTALIDGQYVTLSPEEEQRVRDEWARNEREAQEEQEAEAQEEERQRVRERILDKRAIGEEPDPSDIARFRELSR